MISEAYIYEAIRTPRGKAKNGALHGVKPVTMLTDLIHEILDRNPGLDPVLVEDIVVGCVTPVGDQGANIARTAAIASGLPDAAGAGTTINRFCASALEAVNLTAAKIRSGWESMAIAGGVECMSRVPMGMDGGAWAMDPETAYDSYFVPQGISADLIATIEGFTRDDVDAYAVRSQERAAAAWADGRFAKSVVPVKDRNGIVLLDHDEHMRPGTTAEMLGKLKPSFAGMGEMGGFDAVALQKYHWVEGINHVHTGGNSSGIVDGAAHGPDRQRAGRPGGRHDPARARRRLGGRRLRAHDHADRPDAGHREGAEDRGPDDRRHRRVRAQRGLRGRRAQVDARTSTSIPDKVNVNGGAIAMGHPLGATGAMIIGTCLDELERTGGRYGLITLCIGGGMGVATIIERL